MALVAALFALLFHVGTMPWLARLLNFVLDFENAGHVSHNEGV